MMRLPLSPLMFPDRLDLFPIQVGGVDPSAGRVDRYDPDPSAAGVIARLGVPDEGDMAEAQSLGVKLQTMVAFRQDPGELGPGSRVRVASLDGVPPARETWLQVQHVSRQSAPGFAIWRAFCTGKA